MDAYIATAEPVGSKLLSKYDDLNLSSATIRNEMSELEEMGYLEKPHTSAGRVPSERGYRFYVDSLMELYEPTVQEQLIIRSLLQMRLREVERIISEAGRMISELTSYTAVAMTPRQSHGSIQSFKLMPVESDTLMLIMVTSGGTVRSQLCRFDGETDPQVISRIERILNDRLTNITLDELTMPLMLAAESELREYASQVTELLRCICRTIEDADSAEVFLEGATNILNFPEFHDVLKARSLLGFLGRKDEMRRLLSALECDGVTAVIGSENPLQQMRENSMVLGSYKIGGRMAGVVGVIGPTRMAYPKVVAHLRMLTASLNTLLSENPPEDGSTKND